MAEYNLKHCAYIGDAVWELFIRKICIDKAQTQKAMHNFGIRFVNANMQAEILSYLQDFFDENEKEISRRGRNLKISISKKNNPQIHSLATAFEVILGHLYLNNQNRLEEIFEIIKKYLSEEYNV